MDCYYATNLSKLFSNKNGKGHKIYYPTDIPARTRYTKHTEEEKIIIDDVQCTLHSNSNQIHRITVGTKEKGKI